MTAIINLPDGAKPRKVKARTAAPAAAPVPTPAPRVFEPLEGLPATPVASQVPTALSVNLDNIPDELKSLRRWVCWAYEDGRKLPKIAGSSSNASSTNPSTWTSYEQAARAYATGRYSGIGIVLDGDGLVGVDLDKCVVNGVPDPAALAHMASVGCEYVELSPSGTGLRGLGYASNLDSGTAGIVDGVNVELYSSGRYLTLTGHVLRDGPLVPLHGFHALADRVVAAKESAKTAPTAPTYPHGANERGHMWAQAALDGAVGDVASAGAGGRNNALNDNALRLFRITLGGLLEEGVVQQRLEAAGVAAGLTRSEVLATLRSARAGARKEGPVHAPKPTEKPRHQPARTWQVDEDGVILDEPTFPPLDEAAQPRLTGLALLNSFALNGQSQAMRAKMLDDVHILGKLALMGQITAFYTERNGGKTLLTLWLLIDSIKRGVIDPANVYYINSDDTHKGLVEKTEFAETWGFKMLSDGYNGFKNELLIDVMRGMCEADEARGKVFILDTLKKFTDVMKIEKGTAFMQQLRAFALQGGSVILLGHVNKHRGDDGKLVYKGTTDVVDDADCYYIMDKVQKQDVTIVTFENGKARGDVVTSACYSFQRSREGGQTYAELLDTVQAVDDSEVQKARDEEERAMFAASRQAVIDAIFDAIGAGKTKRTDLINEAHHASGVSKVKVTEVLDKFTGHHWQVTKGQTSGKVYSVLPDTSET